MTAPATICLFAKPPRPGEVKTRLARGIGDVAAAEVANAFVFDTLERFTRRPSLRLVLATTDSDAVEWRDIAGIGTGDIAIWPQGEGDLGARIERVLRRALEESPVALAIGADAPDLPLERVDEAIALLAGGDDTARVDAVLVPAEDGGFALLGLRRCPPGLLDDLPWSAAHTFAATRSRLEAAGLRVAMLAPWRDIDEVADLRQLERRLRDDAALRDELPRTATWLAANPSLAIIVPTLNEVARIDALLEHLIGLFGVDEILVVDGGSTDGTGDRVASYPGVDLLHTAPGRARQMNAGAAAARSEILLFLHADVRLPADAPARVRRTLAPSSRSPAVAGAFRIRTLAEGRRGWIRWFLPIADARSRYSRLPYGDQALFLRSETFRAAGGFPEQALMEDLELARRLSRLGRIVVDRGVVEVSGRRFFARPIYYPLAINLFPLFYALGVSPARLSRWYGNPR
jgi:rSAM/selenodomain-associated transferase 2/rSAM/selenodomain-associated transferase 1